MPMRLAVKIVLMCATAFVGRLSFGVSAWAPSAGRLSFNLSRNSITTGYAGTGTHQLHFRGGNNAILSNLLSKAAHLSANLHCSATSKESQTAKSSTSEEGDLGFYRESLRLGLKVLDFGGLSYWNISDQKNPKFRVLFVLGGPGAGKGTQSALMVENYPVVHLSVGELLRQEQTKEDSPNRKLIEQALVSGSIVPVEVSLGLVQKAMQEESAKSGQDILFLVDGFPRNEDNLSGWCRYMSHVASIWSVLFYQCPLEELEKRILERAKNSGRSDDNLESIHKRFATFERDTMPIVRKLSTVSLDDPWSVIEIAGNQTLDDVWLKTQQALNQLIQHDVLSANAKLLQAVEQGDVNMYRSVCDPAWFKEGADPATILEKQEGKPLPIGAICDAELEFVSGKHVAVSYHRTMEGQQVKEKRIWVYEGLLGWRNVHFARS